MTQTFGIFYIVSTPIGNRDDITLRALTVLKTVDLIAAEDTRHSRPLLQHYGITTPLISLHHFNEHARVPMLLAHLQAGKNIALISDAGTPLISDPGYILVGALCEAGITLCPIPGACAAITALCASGLPTDHFVFAGFLPSQPTARQKKLSTFLKTTSTMICYESPHRILDCAKDISAIFGQNHAVVFAKELTKHFETFFRGTAQAACIWLAENPDHQKGEFVVIIQGIPKTKTAVDTEETQRILSILSDELSSKQAIALAEKITGMPKNKLKEMQFGQKN